MAALARRGRLSRGWGTSSGRVKQMASTRAAVFDGSMGCMSVATSQKNDIVTPGIFFAFLGKFCDLGKQYQVYKCLGNNVRKECSDVRKEDTTHKGIQ